MEISLFLTDINLNCNPISPRPFKTFEVYVLVPELAVDSGLTTVTQPFKSLMFICSPPKVTIDPIVLDQLLVPSKLS